MLARGTRRLCSAAAADVKVKMVAAAVLPSDLGAMLSGFAKPGTDGVGKVVSAGAGSPFKAGDHVIPLAGAVSTWQSEVTAFASGLHKIDQKVPTTMAAYLSTVLPTALAVLDSAEVGTVLVQNGADSPVGQCVAQLAKLKGVLTVNLVSSAESVTLLKSLGGDVVMQSSSANLSALTKALPKGAVNTAVFNDGDHAQLLFKLLQDGAEACVLSSAASLRLGSGTMLSNHITVRGLNMVSLAAVNHEAYKSLLDQAVRASASIKPPVCPADKLATLESNQDDAWWKSSPLIVM